MRKPNDDTGLWFNQVGMFGVGKTGRDIVWKMEGNSDEDFGCDEGYAGNYMIYIISENGDLSDISGSITITYNSSKSKSAKQIDGNPSQSLTTLVDIHQSIVAITFGWENTVLFPASKLLMMFPQKQVAVLKSALPL